jgi:hypothetical protein
MKVVHRFSKNPEAITKFYVPNGQHEGSSTLRTHRQLALPNKIVLARQPGTQDLHYPALWFSSVPECESSDILKRPQLPPPKSLKSSLYITTISFHLIT